MTSLQDSSSTVHSKARKIALLPRDFWSRVMAGGRAEDEDPGDIR